MFNPQRLKILFFDIGNVFVSDDPSGCFAYRHLFDRLVGEGREMRAADFFAARTCHVGEGGNLWTFVAQHMPPGEFKEYQKQVRALMYSRWSELSPQVPGMAEAARELAKYYRLGIIANQPAEVEALLEVRGILDLFEVRGISDKLRLDKPDPRIFEWALQEAGVEPGEAMMIGDRIDNDIRPAKALGMQTLWLRLGTQGRGWMPANDFEKHFAASLNSFSYTEVEAKVELERPDLVARTPEELVALLTGA